MVGNLEAGAASFPFFALQLLSGDMIELPDALAERAGRPAADLIAERAGLSWLRTQAMPGLPAIATRALKPKG
jgi:hypothetical protein